MTAHDKQQTPSPSSHVVGGEDIEEAVARRLYEESHKGMRNIWGWDDGGLQDEHPGTRERFLGYARSAISVIAAQPTPAEHVLPTTWGIFTLDGRFTNLVGENEEDAQLTGEEYFTNDFTVRPLYEHPPAPSQGETP